MKQTIAVVGRGAGGDCVTSKKVYSAAMAVVTVTALL